jgi:8-oxo-dGTP diphosphatase
MVENIYSQPSLMTGDVLHVAVGVVVDCHGRILISRRLSGTHLEGMWEFPGGKVEPQDGGVLQALRRELREEVGIDVVSASPLIKTRYVYPEKRVLLDVWRVRQWQGDARAKEGQAIVWVRLEDLKHYAFPPADRPIITALRLPPLYLISPEPAPPLSAFFERLEACLRTGVKLFQLRAKQLPEAQFRSLAREVMRMCDAHDARVLLNAPLAEAKALNAAGVHLTGQRLRQLDVRPLGADCWVAASCHDRDDVEQAGRIGADFIVIAPVQKTRSHPEASLLGWEEFERLAECATQPVFALGGMKPGDLDQARQCGAHGIAAISGIWEAEDLGAALALIVGA